MTYDLLSLIHFFHPQFPLLEALEFSDFESPKFCLNTNLSNVKVLDGHVRVDSRDRK